MSVCVCVKLTRLTFWASYLGGSSAWQRLHEMRFTLFDEQLPPIRGHPVPRQGRKKGRVTKRKKGGANFD